jgi:hypothetical protein
VELASYLREVQDWIIRPQLKGVKDVAGVDAIGGYVKQYHVQPDPMKLVSYGLTFHDVIEAMEKNNVSTGAGYVEHKGESYLVRATGRIQSIEEIESIVVGTRNGVPIYVRRSWWPGRRGASGANSAPARRARTARTWSWARPSCSSGPTAAPSRRRWTRRWPRSSARLPPKGIKAKTVLNRTKLVDATIATVQKNLLEGAILVIVVLLLLLGNWRAALICALAIPLSMLMTATGMVQGKVSGNLMSLGAIDFGLIVDGAVIIVENCLRRLGEEQHHKGRLLTLQERLHDRDGRRKEMIQPRSSAGDHHHGLLPHPRPLGRRGQDVPPDGPDGHLRAHRGVHPLADLHARDGGHPHHRQGHREGHVPDPLGQGRLRAGRPLGGQLRYAVVAAAVLAFVGFAGCSRGWARSSCPRSTRRTSRCTRCASLDRDHAVAGDAVRRGEGRLVVPRGRVRLLQDRHGGMATDPMPPNVSDTFIIFKDKSQWRSEAELDRLIAEKTEEMEKMGAHGGPRRHDEHGLEAKGDEGRTPTGEDRRAQGQAASS